MQDVKMPQLGQSVEEASIIEWFKAEGDSVQEGERLFSIQTDKAEIECESTASGVVRKILVAPDVTVPILTVVALVGGSDEPLPDLEQYKIDVEPNAETAVATEASRATAATRTTTTSATMAVSGTAPVSPRARARAEELGVDTAFVAGSGADGRIVEADVLAYAERVGPSKVTSTARRLARARGVDPAAVQGTGPRGKVMKADVATATSAAAVAVPAGRGVPLSPMRRIIARRMCESLFSAPHYFVTIEADMTAAHAFRESCTGFRLSQNDLVAWAAALALAECPAVNARWLGDAIEQVGDINLGIAVALDDGLIVPVVKRVQTLSLEAFHLAAEGLIEKARAGRLQPDEYTGNTFTISNMGALGVDEFTAIINPPDSAILAVGEIKDRPVVVAGEIVVRPIVKLTLSSDHRVVDGAVAANFLSVLKKKLEEAAF